MPSRRKRARTPILPPLSPFPGAHSASSCLALVLSWFDEEIARRHYAKRTRDNYLTGVRRLAHFLGRSRQLQAIQRVKAWLQGEDLAPKAREPIMTAGRSFFAALTDSGTLTANPCEDIYAVKPGFPPPETPYDSEAEPLRYNAARIADRTANPDPVPALLVLSVGEATRLTVQDIDLSNRLRPVIPIRYEHRPHRAKRRKPFAAPELCPLLALLDEYRTTRTDRNVEQLPAPSHRDIRRVVADLRCQADIRRPVNPSALRWTSAVNQWEAGGPPTTLRNRLGLSDPGRHDVKHRLTQLAQQPV